MFRNAPTPIHLIKRPQRHLKLTPAQVNLLFSMKPETWVPVIYDARYKLKKHIVTNVNFMPIQFKPNLSSQFPMDQLFKGYHYFVKNAQDYIVLDNMIEFIDDYYVPFLNKSWNKIIAEARKNKKLARSLNDKLNPVTNQYEPIFTADILPFQGTGQAKRFKKLGSPDIDSDLDSETDTEDFDNFDVPRRSARPITFKTENDDEWTEVGEIPKLEDIYQKIKAAREKVPKKLTSVKYLKNLYRQTLDFLHNYNKSSAWLDECSKYLKAWKKVSYKEYIDLGIEDQATFKSALKTYIDEFKRYIESEATSVNATITTFENMMPQLETTLADLKLKLDNLQGINEGEDTEEITKLKEEIKEQELFIKDKKDTITKQQKLKGMLKETIDSITATTTNYFAAENWLELMYKKITDLVENPNEDCYTYLVSQLAVCELIVYIIKPRFMPHLHLAIVKVLDITKTNQTEFLLSRWTEYVGHFEVFDYEDPLTMEFVTNRTLYKITAFALFLTNLIEPLEFISFYSISNFKPVPGLIKVKIGSFLLKDIHTQFTREKSWGTRVRMADLSMATDRGNFKTQI